MLKSSEKISFCLTPINDDGRHQPRWMPPKRTMSDSKKAEVDAKKERFEKERYEILKELPGSLKDRFGQIFFAKWSGTTLPVLVLNPFSVAPGQVRNMWHVMFEKVCILLSRTPSFKLLQHAKGSSVTS